MSFVDSQQKICFVHIAKNGGRSVMGYLGSGAWPYINTEDSIHLWMGNGHANYYQALQTFGKKDWFAFVVLRKPMDRIRSAFNIGVRTGLYEASETSFSRWVSGIEKLSEDKSWSSGDWLWCPHGQSLDPALVPQTFYFDHQNHEIKCFKLESLHTLHNHIRENFENYRNNKRPFSKTSDGDYQKSYKINLKDKKILEKIYKEDFEIYEKNNMF